MELTCEYRPVKILKVDHLLFNEKSSTQNIYNYFKQQTHSNNIKHIVQMSSTAMGYGKSTIYNILKVEKSVVINQITKRKRDVLFIAVRLTIKYQL